MTRAPRSTPSPPDAPGFGTPAFRRLGLAWDGKTTDALAVMFSPTLSCYDSVVAAVMGLFPFLS